MMLFELTDIEALSVEEWDKNHTCKVRENKTTVGGRLRYIFTPTSMGVIVKVECVCGAEINLTDYDKW